MKKLTILNAILFLLSFSIFAQYDDASSTINPDTTLPDAPTAQVIVDDLIVQGSVGLGLDMPSSYAFGFNTLVMRENNLRMFFDDTSISGSFPSNDWTIELNSSNNGGDNYFRVSDATAGTAPFTIQSGAGNNALFVSRTGGNIGLGTASPVTELQITDGDTPTIRLEQDGSMGYAPQTFDLAGNEANFFIRDVNANALPFRIQPGAPENSLTLKSGGKVGVGTWFPEHTLEVVGDVQVNSYFYFGDESTDGNWRVSVVAGKLTFEKREAGVWVSKIEME